jgi:hypothetical protein
LSILRAKIDYQQTLIMNVMHGDTTNL